MIFPGLSKEPKSPKSLREVCTLLLMGSGKRCDSGLMTGVSQGNSVANPAHPALASAAGDTRALTKPRRYSPLEGQALMIVHKVPWSACSSRTDHVRHSKVCRHCEQGYRFSSGGTLHRRASLVKEASASHKFPEWRDRTHGSQRTAFARPQ